MYITIVMFFCNYMKNLILFIWVWHSCETNKALWNKTQKCPMCRKDWQQPIRAFWCQAGLQTRWFPILRFLQHPYGENYLRGWLKAQSFIKVSCLWRMLMMLTSLAEVSAKLKPLSLSSLRKRGAFHCSLLVNFSIVCLYINCLARKSDLKK